MTKISKDRCRVNIIDGIIIFKLSMDYQKLYQELPKLPARWSVNDIQTWLKFVGLSNLYPKFKQLSIDGSCITFLTEEDLREQLNIQSSIIIKKILTWVSRGFNEYSSFVENRQAAGGFTEIQEATQKSKGVSPLAPVDDIKLIFKTAANKQVSNMLISNGGVSRQLQKETGAQEQVKVADEQVQNKKKEIELIIHQSDGPQTSFFSVKQGGAKIGRHSSNQILILEQSISRYHAEIKFSNGLFYLKDTGSTTGTFIKIDDRKQIYHNMLIQMGSNQFQSSIVSGILTLTIIEGPALGLSMEIPKQAKVTIGRKPSNLLSFPDDLHLSTIHSTISHIQGKYYVEDMGTTNGTWQRLSMEGQASQLFEICDKTSFKIGSNQTYVCKIKMSFLIQKQYPNACVICCLLEKDCVYMPCKHNIACIKCSKSFKECPLCRTKIEDYVRIYKA